MCVRLQEICDSIESSLPDALKDLTVAEYKQRSIKTGKQKKEEIKIKKPKKLTQAEMKAAALRLTKKPKKPKKSENENSFNLNIKAFRRSLKTDPKARTKGPWRPVNTPLAVRQCEDGLQAQREYGRGLIIGFEPEVLPF